ncbi:hypothetical protein SteCoe_28885 [Stentor coeruleus]|uniref:Tubulin--tyrosine ligase-like protein 5 n=1 Tax=Stentor coeruleus TaxID=5963 RepID=A0A1R2B7P1_9CILI|nr:hypothetical protein SteCoe_28885 [Stentor coeruleus]
MDEKIHKTSYAGFSIVSVAPSRPNQIDPGIVAKIKTLQVSESTNCQGISLEGIIKAGKSLHGKNHLSSYALKYFENSRLTLERLTTEIDIRPPLIKFSAVKELKTQYNDILSYRMFQSDVKLVKTILENAGFIATEGHDWNLLWIGHNLKPNFYDKLNAYQKISHFPNSYEITRKDCLCSAIIRMQEIYGKDAFNFTPETYNLPENFSLLYSNFFKEKKSVWIVKPTCSSQGKGIYLIDSVNEIPTEETCIVSRYISNPLLINSLKFDLRIYVLVSSYEPLRIYIYEEGLARFASEIYKPGHKNNRFMHLTNYSLNKKSENFVQNEDFRLDNTGHKWSLSAIIKLLEANGICTNLLMKNIYEIIIKTILSRENAIIETAHKLGLHRTSCFDLLGFDVLIDNNLKPWLLEVNLSPSMATDSSLDSYIKSNLLADMFNLIGLRAYDKKKDVYGRNRSFAKTQKKRNDCSQSPPRGRKDVSKKYQEVLKETLEEQERRGHFIRIYPSKGTNYFDQFFSSPRQINMYLYKALYIDLMQENDFLYYKPNTATFSSGLKQEFRYFKSRPGTCNIDSEIFCPPISQLKAHQQRPVSIDNLSNGLDTKTEDSNIKCRNCKDNQTLCLFCRLLKITKEEKCVITSDDLLMEYLARLVQVFEKNKDKESLKKSVWKFKLNSFITHSGGICSDIGQKMCKKVKSKLEEMKERRRKLASVLKRKKISLEDMEKEDVVGGVLKKFNSCELEELLKISSKNAVLELLKY